jgi:hypothetical protein
MLYSSATYSDSQAMPTVGSPFLKGIRDGVKIRASGPLSQAIN